MNIDKDKSKFLIANIKTRETKINNEMYFYNTDKNIFSLYVKMTTLDELENEIDLLYKQVKDIILNLTVVKPKTKELREVNGELIKADFGIFHFDLPDDFIDQTGVYLCELKIINGEEHLTLNPFQYTVRKSVATGLNIEIESDPDLPILKQLIEEVRYISHGGTGIDDTIISTERTWSSYFINNKFETFKPKDGAMFIESDVAPTDTSVIWIDNSIINGLNNSTYEGIVGELLLVIRDLKNRILTLENKVATIINGGIIPSEDNYILLADSSFIQLENGQYLERG